MNNNKTNIAKKFNILLVLSVFIYMLFINFYSPMFADDYANSFIRGTSIRMETIYDVFKNTYFTFIGWTGRYTTSFLLYLNIFLGKYIFNVINSLVFVMYIVLVCLITNCRYEDKKFALKFLFTLLLSWFGLPVFGETVIWLTGSIVYLWAIIINLVFLFPYINLFNNHKVSESKFMMLILLIGGLFAGGTLENIVPVEVCIIILFFIILRKKIKIPIWFYSGLIGLITGMILLIFSPGNSQRALIEGVNPNYSINIQQVIYFFKEPFMQVLIHEKVIFISFITLFTIVGIGFILNKQFKNYQKQVLCSVLFFVCSIMSNCAMIFSPYFPIRTAIPGAVFLIISNMFLFEIILNYNFKKTIKTAFLMCMLILCIIPMKKTFIDYKNLNEQNLDRIQTIKKDEKNKKIIVAKFDVISKPEFDQGSRHVFIRDITSDENYWTNKIFASYFNLDSIKTMNETKFDLSSFDTSKSILTKQDFRLIEDIVIKDIKVVKYNKTSNLVIEFNKDIDFNKINDKVLFIHLYPNSKDIEKYKKDEIQYGFLNCDYFFDLKNIDGRIFGIKNINVKDNEFEKIVIGLYDNKLGNIGSQLSEQLIKFN